MFIIVGVKQSVSSDACVVRLISISGKAEFGGESTLTGTLTSSNGNVKVNVEETYQLDDEGTMYALKVDSTEGLVKYFDYEFKFI